jgi:hypothetical protein
MPLVILTGVDPVSDGVIPLVFVTASWLSPLTSAKVMATETAAVASNPATTRTRVRRFGDFDRTT